MKRMYSLILSSFILTFAMLFFVQAKAVEFRANSAVVVIGASGEEVDCPDLVEANYEGLASLLNPENLMKNNIRRIYFFIYNERLYPQILVELPKFGSRKIKFVELAKKVQRALSEIYGNRIYGYKLKEVNGKEVLTRRDVVGMLTNLNDFINSNGLNNGHKVYVFIASTMKQTIYLGKDRKSILSYIRRHENQFKFRNVDMYILGKKSVCSTAPASAINELHLNYENVWKGVIKTINGEFHYMFSNY